MLRKKEGLTLLIVLFMISAGVTFGSTSNFSASGQDSESSQSSDESNCITCHRVLEGPDAEEGSVHEFSLSAHAEAGLDCSDCHGGDRTALADLENFDYSDAKGPGTGFRGVPTRSEIPRFCGRCHSDPEYMRRFNPQQRIDQENLYMSSGHGQALARGNSKVATCVDCHSTHLILKASDPRSTIAPQHVPATCQNCHSDSFTMAGSNLNTDIGEEYRGSVHGMALLERGDLGAPACNDCHGNHGAAPPGYSSVSAVCSQCHVSTANDFQNSIHGLIFEMIAEPQCESCHSNHAIARTSDSMLEEDGVCSNCHIPDDVGFQVAATMLRELKLLESEITEADSLLAVAHRKGMEISEGRYTLRQAENGLVKGRAAVHTFSIESLQEVTVLGMESAQRAGETGSAALDAFKRRRGGWEVFLFLCVIVIVGMWIMLRRMEGPGGRYPMREPE